MARAVQTNTDANDDTCCVRGLVPLKCNPCGGHPRQVSTCQRCRGAGCTYVPCPTHAAYESTGYNFTPYNGSNGSSTGSGMSTYGQNHGSSSSQ